MAAQPTLNTNRLITVTVNITAKQVAGRTFNVLMIAGDSNVINGSDRLASFTSFDDVENEFGANAPETQAAELYFEQDPQPTTLMIGRWIRTATAAINIGGILSASAQVLANWTAITAGSFEITIDGSLQTLSSLDFSGAINLNGVATVITTALSGGATCVWNGSNFEIISGSTGSGGFATGAVTLTSNPSANDTLTLGGTAITFVASGASGSEVNIGATNLVTLANLLAFLSGSSDSNLEKCNYSILGNVLTLKFKTQTATGNSFSLAKSSSAISLSGGDLAGGAVPSSVGFASATGSGTDISAMLALTSSTSLELVPGYAAESPLQCATILSNLSQVWYGLQFNASVQPTDSQNIAVAGFIQAQLVTRLFGITSQDANTLSAESTTDLAYQLQQLAYKNTFVQYSSTNIAAVAALFGVAFGVDFTQTDSTITLMYKPEVGVVAESLNDDQANALEAKNCNVFVNYSVDPAEPTPIIQYGTVASGDFIDEIQGADWFQNASQVAAWNVLYGSRKIAQTDQANQQFVNAEAGVCELAINNDFAAPGLWEGPSFGALKNGQYLKLGYYIYILPVAQQSEADRAARKLPPMQVALKLAGANQTVNMLVNINP